jgi:tellurite resistance protein
LATGRFVLEDPFDFAELLIHHIPGPGSSKCILKQECCLSRFSRVLPSPILSASSAAIPADAPSASATPVGDRPIWEGLPISLFGSVMGMTGLSVSWQLVATHFGGPDWISKTFGVLAGVLFAVLIAGYGVKVLKSPAAVRAEFAHPIQGNLFGTFIISVLLLPVLIAPRSLALAQSLWILGAVLMIGFAWLILTRWMSERQLTSHATPVWIVPVVGVLDVPIALPDLDLANSHIVMVAAISIGLFFAVPLFTLILSRLIFEEPLPPALEPTLLILVAPFALGFTGYVAMTGGIDLFAQSLYVLMLFLLSVLVPRLARLPLCCPFRFAWWSVGFPLAASANASLIFAVAHPGWLTRCIAFIVLGLASLTITLLLWRSLLGISRGELRAMTQ